MERRRPMNIVVLDGYTANPGDLSWEALTAQGTCRIYDRTPPEQTVERARSAEIVLTNKVVLDRDVIAHLPKLKYVGVLATGYNVVDLDAANERGIVVTNVPAYSTESVVQIVFAHLFHLTHHVAEHSAGARAGKWTRSPDFAYWDYPLVEVAGLTMGIVGFGGIGRRVAAVAQALGMQALINTRTPPSDPAGCEVVALDDLFKRSDVVTLHCPLTPQTKHLVNAERLAMMKPTAFLINCSRGPVVDELALADALNAGALAGAGVDVLSTEPPAADNPLLTAHNCAITPHVGWATSAARQRLMEVATANVHAFVAGHPVNVVNTVNVVNAPESAE